MSSGYGAYGGTGRCYKFWTILRDCVNENTDKSVCKPAGEDYIECLHHKKEFDRINEIEKRRKRVLKDAAIESGH